jgi:hypothetical protein
MVQDFGVLQTRTLKSHLTYKSHIHIAPHKHLKVNLVSFIYFYSLRAIISRLPNSVAYLLWKWTLIEAHKDVPIYIPILSKDCCRPSPCFKDHESMCEAPQCRALLTKGQIYSLFCAGIRKRNATQPTTPGNMLLAVMLIKPPLAPES